VSHQLKMLICSVDTEFCVARTVHRACVECHFGFNASYTWL